MSMRRRGRVKAGSSRPAACGPETLERRCCPAIVSLSAPPEVDETVGQTDVLITISEPVAATTSVNYTFLNGPGTAIFGRDYVVSLDGRQLRSSGILTFRPGQTSTALRITVPNDGLVEQVETFSMTLFSARGLSLGTRQATVSINDAGGGGGSGGGGGGPINPGLPEIRITGPGTVAEASGRSTVVVGLSQPSSQSVTVGYAITPFFGQATAASSAPKPATYGIDSLLTLAGRRLPATGTLTFRPGQTSITLDMGVINDRVREGDEGFTVSLQRSSAAVLDAAAASTSVIIDDDDDYTVSILGASPIAAGQPYDFLVELSAPATQREIFYATTIDGTAKATLDYQPLFRAPVVIQPGQTTGRLRIATIADRPDSPEYDETFAIKLQPLSAGFPAPTPDFPVTIAGPLGPRPPDISISDTSLQEGAVGYSTEAVFTVTLASPWTNPVTVSYATADGTATVADGDFIDTVGTLTFAPGQTVQTVRVPVIGDNRGEPDETFTVTLSSPVNTIIARATGTGTIVNDDAPEYQIVVVFPDNSLTAAQQAVFLSAAARWSEIIVADLPDATYRGRTIDDLEIEASAPFIDGAGGILGQAGPDAWRGNFLPYAGTMEFDSADVAEMVAEGTFEDVILHEMGHVIGIGTVWSLKNVVRGIGTANPEFIGANAVREYQTLSGTQATAVPVENTGGPGTAGGHWRESVFGRELMTGYAEPAGTPMPISRLTIGSLEDLGYTVDYAAADPFTLNLRQAAANFRQLQLPQNRRAQRFMLTAGEDPVPDLFAAAAATASDAHGRAESSTAKARVFRSIACRPT